MKNILASLIVLALSCVGLHAQTNTNAFVVTLPAPVTMTTVVPANLTVLTVLINPSAQTIIVRFKERAPLVIQGSDFVAFESQFQGRFAASIAAYMTDNPNK